jgi:tetratricopeptide (TPR) repeat protein
LLISLLLLVATFAVYAPVNHYDFADVDDDAYITDNLHIKYGLDWDAVEWSFTSYYVANWHPVTWLSHALDCQIAGLNPGRHHNVNVALHGLNALLLFWVLLTATGYMGRSAMVAALFALHPINVESVVWIAQRKNVLSMLFFLLALGAYRWYAMKTGLLKYLVVALCFALGLMAKPQVITLPFLLLLWDYWPLRRMFAADAALDLHSGVSSPPAPPRKFLWLILEKLPLLALSAGSAVVTIKAQRAGGAMNPLNNFPLSARIGNAIVSYARYVGKAFWPVRLSALYPYPRDGASASSLLFSCVLLLGITAIVIGARRRRWPFVGWLWFLGTLVPMIGVIQVGDQSMADRYAYLPFIGLFLVICWGVPELVFANVKSPRAKKLWLSAAALTVAVALAVLTHHQVRYWRSSVELWSHTTQVTSDNDAAETYLGQALVRAGRSQAAIPHFERAISIAPAAPKAYMFLGYAEQQVGQPQKAIEYYQRALDLCQRYGAFALPIRVATLQSMAYAYRDLGDYPRATQCLEAAQQAAER